ncbi:MAG: glycoside hydrolase family 2 [Clostridia bacterium]|nr:glycoside hydrolase family 2 [Clostridia bacterium]
MEKLLTRWGKSLNREMPLSEYPRPQMERNSFICLNGIWDYAIYPSVAEFKGYEGEIVVPFSPECILSSVERNVTPDDTLYYRKKFNFKKTNDRVLLHFGAVDYKCEVSVNGTVFGTHTGGYFPFNVDITKAVIDGENEITLKVTDPSETSSQASGKQTSKRGNIWYTPQSGIWQTVWIEEVPENYIKSVKLTPDIDNDLLKVQIIAEGSLGEVTLVASDNGKTLCTVTTSGDTAVLKLSEYEKWTPENPKLYDLKVSGGKDEVKCYFGMRKFSVGKDEKGFSRLMLNNEPYFHNGLLDQGYWSDGMYTAPDDEALIYDIKTMKDMGFNMLRKHIKIEPLRWYYHCDRLGMLVWQDMINGGDVYNNAATTLLPAVGLATGLKKTFGVKDTKVNYKLFSRQDKKGREEYYTDAARMIDTLYNSVSICLWVPFNEGWGQFDSVKATEFFREKDSTRIIDHASGWHDQGAGDLNSFHIYFTPFFFPKYGKDDDRVVALTEFGGYSMSIDGHRFNTDKTFGYRIYKSKAALEKALEALYIKRIQPLIYKKGLSALVYTEVSDVEDETNGLLTYDREIVKVDIDLMKRINENIRL